MAIIRAARAINARFSAVAKAAGGFQVPASFSVWRPSWVAGGGSEFRPFPSPWILGVEYLYYRFDGTSGATGALSPVDPASVGDYDVQTVGARLSYKFN
jgi:opacity protein-like surface antigen